MAKVNEKALARQRFHAHAFGNQGVLHTQVTVSADDDDTIHLIRVPAYTKLLDLKVVNDAGGADSAIKLGYLPADGTDGDDDYFTGVKSTVSAGVIRADAANPVVTTDRITDIVATVDSAVTDLTLDIILTYEWQGDE